MTEGRHRSHRFRLAVIVGSLLGASLVAGSAGAKMVVLSAQGDAALKTGALLPDDQSLHLAAGATAKIMQDDGEVILINGPFNGRVAASSGNAAPLAGAVSEFLNRPAAPALSSSRGGVSSGTDDPWVVDVTSQGHKCVRSLDEIMLWRTAPEAATSATLNAAALGTTWRIRWPAGADRVKWPSQIPAQDGGSYVIALADTGDSREFTLHIAPADAVNSGRQLAWMVQKDCAAQVLLWAEKIPENRTLGRKANP